MSNIIKNDFNFQEMQQAAETIHKSKLFPIWDSPEKIMVLMMVTKSEGIDPITAMQRYDMIDGRLSKKPGAMLGDFISAGGKVSWISNDDKVAKAEFITPTGVKHIEEFTMQDADKAGLSRKSNWQKYPKAMLRARCISAALRAVYPSATNLLYTPEETEDIEPVKKNKINEIFQPKKEEIVEIIKSEPVIVEQDYIEVIDAEEVNPLENLKELPADQLVGFLRSIKWLTGTDLSELTTARIESIVNNYEKFKEKVLNFKLN